MWDPSVTPTSLPKSGGPVNLAVSAWDLRGISEAYASIAGPAGASYNVPLEPISADRFTGVFNAPANTGIFPAYYEIEFSAIDDIGQQTIVSGERVTVAARPTGQLKITPGDSQLREGQAGQDRAADHRGQEPSEPRARCRSAASSRRRARRSPSSGRRRRASRSG